MGRGSSFGRYSYVLSGINPEEVYAAAEKFGERLRSYDGFVAPPRSDLFRNTPNIDIEIDRDRASLYGISTTISRRCSAPPIRKITSISSSRPDDQYQVILEVDDNERAGPEDLRQLYVKSDTDRQPPPDSHHDEGAHDSGCSR